MRRIELILALALSGLAEVSARWWLDAPGSVPKERAVELLDVVAPLQDIGDHQAGLGQVR